MDVNEIIRQKLDMSRISAALEPVKEATEKYAGTYVGKNNLATIKEGQDLVEVFLAVKGSRPVQSVQLLAEDFHGQETYVKVEEMITDKFPTNKPIDIFMEVEQGAPRPTGDDVGGEELHPAATKGHILINVYAFYVSVQKVGAEEAVNRMLAEVDNAYKASQTPPPPPAPAPAKASAPAKSEASAEKHNK